MEMGSSGRPNKAIELQNFERVSPTLLQIPGIDPTWLAKEAIRRMDDRLDITDAMAAGMPSIQALNAILAKAGQGAGGAAALPAPATEADAQDPAMQGGQGASNGVDPQQNEPPPAAIDHGAPDPGPLGPIMS
jgi:hypothetical protein